MEISCDCEKCQAMCANSTCLPTPDEVRKLIRAGYADKLASYSWGGRGYIAPAPQGMEGCKSLPNTLQGACVFFDGKHCQVHAKSLKPLEGRLAHHERDWQPIRLYVMNFWKGRKFESVSKMLDKHLSSKVQ